MLVSAVGSLGRLLDHGAGGLETHELISILVRGAEIDPDLVIEVSERIDAGSPGVTGIDSGNGSDLRGEYAAILAVALEIARRMSQAPAPALVCGPADVAVIAQRELGGRRRERVLVVVCDAANRVLRTVVVADGSIDRSMMPVREILNVVLRWDGSAFAIAHNHPGGDPEPSHADFEATKRVADAARVVGLRFLGHVVVTDDSWAAATKTPRTHD